MAVMMVIIKINFINKSKQMYKQIPPIQVSSVSAAVVQNCTSMSAFNHNNNKVMCAARCPDITPPDTTPLGRNPPF